MLSLFFTAPGQVQVFDRHNSLISYFNWLNLLGLCCLIKVEVALDATGGGGAAHRAAAAPGGAPAGAASQGSACCARCAGGTGPPAVVGPPARAPAGARAGEGLTRQEGGGAPGGSGLVPGASPGEEGPAVRLLPGDPASPP